MSSIAATPGDALGPSDRDVIAEVRASLKAMIDDPSTPAAVRQGLAKEFDTLQAMLDKLDQGELHIAVFGRVSVGKSSLLNALLGHKQFEAGPLNGVTRTADLAHWHTGGDSPVHVIDTPGIDEIEGEAREQLAREVAARSDLILFVCEGDLTTVERDALETLCAQHSPVVIALNKADRYTPHELTQLLQRLGERAQGLVAASRIIAVQADPAPQTIISQHPDGSEQISQRSREPDVKALRDCLAEILSAEGKTLAAINAGLFAGQLSDSVAERMAELRSEVGARVIRGYCIAKGLAVAVNPIPLSDLAAAAALDISLIVHLSRVYGLPMTRREAGGLVTVIFAQLAALMGAVWAIHAASSLLKGLSAGVSTALTAIAQGSVAWYATYVTGQIAQRYLINGKSWGPAGPKRAVAAVLETIDRDSVLAEAREAISQHLGERLGKRPNK